MTNRLFPALLIQHEPYPLMVLALDGTILRQNRGAKALFGQLLAEPAALPAAPDIYSLHLDERYLKPAVVGWESLAKSMLFAPASRRASARR